MVLQRVEYVRRRPVDVQGHVWEFKDTYVDYLKSEDRVEGIEPAETTPKAKRANKKASKTESLGEQVSHSDLSGKS